MDRGEGWGEGGQGGQLVHARQGNFTTGVRFQGGMVVPPPAPPVPEDEEMDEVDEVAEAPAKDKDGLDLEFPKSKFNRNFLGAQGRRRQLHVPIGKGFNRYLYMPT